MTAEKVFLSIFTPAYNRANTLQRTYKSLQSQTNKSFDWIVVDDGSTDNTRELVTTWQQKEESFLIRYVYKKNGGFHTAYNTAIEYLAGELAMCVDSDDYLPDDAVELIAKCWQMRGGKQYGGIIGLDYDTNGELIGRMLPEVATINLIDLSLGKYGKRIGDKKVVIRSVLYRRFFPMQVFPGEKYFNPHYEHMRISREYGLIPLNRCLCIVEYQPDGMGTNMYRQYKNSPNSFLEYRKLYFTFEQATLRDNIRNGIHFVSSALLCGRFWSEWLQSDRKALLLACFPPGLLLACVTLWKG